MRAVADEIFGRPVNLVDADNNESTFVYAIHNRVIEQDLQGGVCLMIRREAFQFIAPRAATKNR